MGIGSDVIVGCGPGMDSVECLSSGVHAMHVPLHHISITLCYYVNICALGRTYMA